LFKITDHIIAEVSDGTAVKSGEPGYGDGTVTVQEVSEYVQGLASVFLRSDLPPFLDDDFILSHGEDAMRVRPQKRVPTPFFTALHALQQKDVRLGIQFHKGRDRRFRVREYLPINGDEIPVPRQFCKPLKRWIIHRYRSSTLWDKQAIKKAAGFITALLFFKQKSRGAL
jgi:hypothetical protein